jgi:hypothetical protein
MVESGKPICQSENCLIMATFGNQDEKATRCLTHKELTMIDLFHKTCVFNGCKSRPSYNLPGERTSLYCSEHASDEMFDNVHSKCEEKGCIKIPCFNFEGLTKRLYCSEHAKENMINITTKCCSIEGCDKIPYFNYEGQTRRLYCKEHKFEKMIDISHRCCEYEGCRIRPIFNYKTEKQGRFCKEHKMAGMADIINNNCEHEGCELSPLFNYKGETKRRFCASHKLPDMINLTKTYCKTPLCETYKNPKKEYEGYCLRCFVHTFPDKPNVRNYKTKEKTVADEILKTFTNFTWHIDKKVQDGCSRRRPDLLLDMGTHIIIVEIDENQHANYDSTCEHRRIMEISQDLGHRPIVFIRFNPDDYVDENNAKIQSCFSVNKTGILQISKTKQNEWNDRINILKHQIEKWSNVSHSLQTIQCVNLFFDYI